jgi:dephospho-CoA kinase
MVQAGLTGGIGCGKSTVAAMMRELGCHIIDADSLAHRMIEPGGAAYDQLVKEFGAGVLRSDGTVERSRVAGIVFNDPARLASLNAMVHPPLLAEINRQLAQLASDDPQGIAVIDAALLLEFGHFTKLDATIVVWCTPEQQLARLTDAVSGRGMSREQAERRIASQLSHEEKRKLATYEIDCSGTMAETRQQVLALVERFKIRAAATTS